MGSGTTAIACLNTNRQYIGFELDKQYFDIANQRIEKATAHHKGLKDGTIERTHSYSLTYAKKEVNELKKRKCVMSPKKYGMTLQGKKKKKVKK